ncbi:hypothetical protein M3J09_012114 [Ascochyta lentis]
MVFSKQSSGRLALLALLEGIDCIVATVGYCLSREALASGPREGCYTVVVWLSDNAATLRINQAEKVVCWISGGAALAAATCFLIESSNASEESVPSEEGAKYCHARSIL